MPYYPELGSEQRRRPHEGEEQDAGYTRFEGAKNRFAGGRFRAAKRIQKGRAICRLHGSIHACTSSFQGYVGLLRTADPATPQAFRPCFGRDDQQANGRAVKAVYLGLAVLLIAGRVYPVAWRTPQYRYNRARPTRSLPSLFEILLLGFVRCEPSEVTVIGATDFPFL